MPRRPWLLVAVLSVIASAQLSAAHAAILANRSALTTLPGGSAETEGFESLNIGANTNVALAQTLDATTLVTVNNQEQGPGLILPGLHFQVTGGNLTWNGQGLSKTVGVLSHSPSHFLLSVSFPAGTQAAGVDLGAVGADETLTVTSFAPDGTTILDAPTTIALPLSGNFTTFYATADPQGIGSISIQESGDFFGATMDNVTFGKTPEPATAALLSLAAPLLLARRRRHP
jgi:hypothetical protein